jgi:uncharacterized protein YjbI with pentapeptide repeats
MKYNNNLRKSVMKFIRVLFFLTFLSGILFLPSAFAENVPEWVKNTAGWWATDVISETEFVNAIEFLVKENIIQVNVSQTSETSQGVPDWVKNTAGWWATDVISETEFVNAIAYLIENGIIMISSLDEKYNLCSDTNELSAEIRMQTKLVIKEEWRQLCYDFYDNSYAGYEAITKQESVNYNSHGFRGPEISKEKPDNAYRIITVGGSTTNGLSLVVDNETWPGHLQKKFDERDFGFDIEVINTGMGGHTSITESKLIKDNLIDFSPDLIVVFDGLNDAAWVANPWHDWWEPQSEIAWKDRWSKICDLGKRNGFDTIITVQPFYKSGFQVLTKSDYEQYHQTTPISVSDAYPLYLNQLPELSKNCKKAVDMSSLFDKIPENLFVDQVHVASLGNKIIAEKFYQIILPIVEETQDLESTTFNIISKKDISDLLSLQKLNFNNVNFENLDLSGLDFSGRDLENVVFYNTNMNNIDFTNVNLSGAKFLGGSVDSTNFSDANIENANFMKTKLGNANFSDAVLDETIFFRVDFSHTDLSDTSMIGTKIFESSLKGMTLTGISFIETDLTNSNLSNVDILGNDLTRTILTGVDLSNSNLSGVNLAGMDLTNTNLSGVDLSGQNLIETIFNCIITTITIPCVNFVDTNLENANLSEASFIQVDLTKIKNKSLAGANLSSASFAFSDLSGVNLSGAILDGTNFNKADLSGQDFTVISKASFEGVVFIQANLSNSNFEGVDLSPKQEYSRTFENKAHLIIGVTQSPEAQQNIKEDLFGKVAPVLILSAETRGNDLAVTWVFFNNFAGANLENANLKDTSLRYAIFYNATLTNANLSGADLKNTFFGGADLSNANFSGATGEMHIDENTILKCVGHPICNS